MSISVRERLLDMDVSVQVIHWLGGMAACISDALRDELEMDAETFLKALNLPIPEDESLLDDADYAQELISMSGRNGFLIRLATPVTRYRKPGDPSTAFRSWSYYRTTWIYLDAPDLASGERAFLKAVQAWHAQVRQHDAEHPSD